MSNSLQWVTGFLNENVSYSRGRFTVIPGRPSLSPKIIIALDHKDWGDCVVYVADGEGAAYLRTELSVIKHCHELGLTKHVPKLLFSEDLGSVMAFAVPRYGPAKRIALDIATNLISPIHLATGRRTHLTETPVYESIRAWSQENEKAQADTALLLRLASEMNGWVLSGLIHRDFWWPNIVSDAKSSIIIDWEYSEFDFPVVFDLFQYYVSMGETPAVRSDLVRKLIESPEIAVPVELRPHYADSWAPESLQAIVGVWLADYIKRRAELARDTGNADPDHIESWHWLSHWNSIVATQ